MKILHVIPSVGFVRGGPSKAILEMVKALRELDVEAEIVTTNDNGPNLLDVPSKQKTVYQDIPVWFFPRFSPAIEPIREFAFSSSLTAWLWQHIQNYDLLHIHAIFSYPSTVAMTIARQKKIPYIVRPIGQLCEWSLQQSARKKQIYLDLLERSNLNDSRALHLTSQQEQDEVAQLRLRSQSFVLPLGLTIPTPMPAARQQLRQQLNLEMDEPIILFLSRLHPKKGLDYLIQALSQLTHYRFTLVLAGGGASDYEMQIVSLLKSSGLYDRTHLTGFVTGDYKTLLFQGSDLFTLTSHSENFGISVLEALASGLPALVTPGVALASVVQQYQLGYVPALNVSTIGTELERYFRHPQEALNMGARAQRFIAEHYEWTHIAKKLMEVYTAIINQKPILSLSIEG
jgi:glycosyltransferase involved in cell wall biosynthesis